ncbi:MAG: hypothetical protein Kow0049_13600 [Stanieria sp.]
MLKEFSLIEGGAINPNHWQSDHVKAEIASILGVKIEEIEAINYWLKQIWVKLVGKGSKFVSYRSLSFWFEDALLLIETCQDVVFFEKLGAMFRYELKHHAKYYSCDRLNKLQEAWQQQSPQFQTEASRLLLQLARQKEALKWQENCLKLLAQCRDWHSLDECYWQIRDNGQDFRDLTEVIQTINDFYHQKSDELNQSGDFWTSL